MPIDPVTPNLDHWLPEPAMRIVHARDTAAGPEELWAAARAIRVRDAALLGRLVRWRIPGTKPDVAFDELFRGPPFTVLDGDQDHALVSGLVGRIWTLRRDYPKLSDPDEFRHWAKRGTARVLFASWVEAVGGGSARLTSETRVEVFGVQGRLGLRAVRPLIARFHHRIGSDGIEAAVRRAENLGE